MELIYNGISSKELGLEIINYERMLFADGEGSKEIDITFKRFEVFDRDRVAEEISEWLYTEEDVSIFITDNESKEIVGRVSEVPQYNPLPNGSLEIDVTIKCLPYSYLKEERHVFDSIINLEVKGQVATEFLLVSYIDKDGDSYKLIQDNETKLEITYPFNSGDILEIDTNTFEIRRIRNGQERLMVLEVEGEFPLIEGNTSIRTNIGTSGVSNNEISYRPLYLT